VTDQDRSAKRGLDGVLVVAKPAGPTSHDVVGLVRRLSGTKKVGHGGTLDPFASGVLPVFLGSATRMVEYHMGDEKAYRATICFGATSATDDRDGELVPGEGPAPAREQVEAALAEFRGPILQRPPAFSAMKVGGRRAYQLARRGEAPALKPRPVTIRRLELVEWDGSDPERPTAVVDVECGAGTYIRSLARDLGERLGCGAYLGALTRTRSGPFALDRAVDLDSVRRAGASGAAGLASLVLPVDFGLEGLATVPLTAEEVAAVSTGKQVRPAAKPSLEAGTAIKLLDPRGGLVGMGTWQSGRVVPHKMFVVPAPGRPGSAGRAEGEGPSQAKPHEPRLQYARAGAPHEVVPGIEALRKELGRIFVSVGVFDGLHRGHLYLLRELRHAASRAGGRTAVITFDAHPEEIVNGLAPALLCDPEERLVRLAAAGVEITVVQHFDHALRMTSYREFVESIRARVELAGFVMTSDAAFGHNREGTPEALTQLGEELGFEVALVRPMLLDGEQVRSSEIRARIAAGDFAAARRLLGRPLSVTGIAGAADIDELTTVTFEVPVVLPPEGRYGVLMGKPWTPEAQPQRADRSGFAIVDGGSLRLDSGLRVAPGERVRIVFAD
jgi:tRNA pseudouridine55 synthase